MVWIEESPSNRAECQVCHKRIGKGEKRVGEEGSWYGFWSPRYYHLRCWIQRNKEFVKELLEALPENGSDFYGLFDSDEPLYGVLWIHADKETVEEMLDKYRSEDEEYCIDGFAEFLERHGIKVAGIPINFVYF